MSSPCIFTMSVSLLMSGSLARATAVTADGGLYAFSTNNYGQLGSATGSGRDNANPTPMLVSLPGASGPAIDKGRHG